jgi:hypothetical protein
MLLHLSFTCFVVGLVFSWHYFYSNVTKRMWLITLDSGYGENYSYEPLLVSDLCRNANRANWNLSNTAMSIFDSDYHHLLFTLSKQSFSRIYNIEPEALLRFYNMPNVVLPEHDFVLYSKEFRSSEEYQNIGRWPTFFSFSHRIKVPRNDMAFVSASTLVVLFGKIHFHITVKTDGNPGIFPVDEF